MVSQALSTLLLVLAPLCAVACTRAVPWQQDYASDCTFPCFGEISILLSRLRPTTASHLPRCRYHGTRPERCRSWRRLMHPWSCSRRRPKRQSLSAKSFSQRSQPSRQRPWARRAASSSWPSRGMKKLWSACSMLCVSMQQLICNAQQCPTS